jgi:hypothetical protein
MLAFAAGIVGENQHKLEKVRFEENLLLHCQKIMLHRDFHHVFHLFKSIY